MLQVIGKPVRVQFMRWDEHGWDNFSPAQVTDVRAGIDAANSRDCPIYVECLYMQISMNTAAGENAA